MTGPIYLYSTLHEDALQALIAQQGKDFDILLGDLFSDDELERYEKWLDHLALLDANAILSELTVDDLNIAPEQTQAQVDFFQKCKSTVSIENLGFIETNPFQVSYLLAFLERMDECLVDLGGMEDLVFKTQWQGDLRRLRQMETLVRIERPLPVIPLAATITQVDRIVHEIYRELERLGVETIDTSEMAEKRTRIITPMLQGQYSSNELLTLSGLNPKDFGDGLEGLKFYLKRLP